MDSGRHLMYFSTAAVGEDNFSKLSSSSISFDSTSLSNSEPAWLPNNTLSTLATSILLLLSTGHCSWTLPKKGRGGIHSWPCPFTIIASVAKHNNGQRRGRTHDANNIINTTSTAGIIIINITRLTQRSLDSATGSFFNQIIFCANKVIPIRKTFIRSTDTQETQETQQNTTLPHRRTRY